MLQKIIRRLLYRHHPWRAMDFDELGEIYASMLLRSLAMSIVGVFVPIYLYQSGYTLTDIMFFYGVFFTARIAWDFIGGHLVARFGPKHTMIIAYILQITVLAMFTTLSSVTWPLALMAVIGAGSNSVFFIAFHTDFSKIKHTKKAGNEVGWLKIIERVGALLGPIVGGLIAAYIGPSYTFGFAVLLFIGGLIPLFFTGEPVVTNQNLNFSFDVRKIKWDIVSYAGLTVENTVCVVMWPLFLALIIFKSNLFIQIGFVSSIAVVLSLISSRAVGKLIDAKKGRKLLRIAACTNAVVHLFRPFTMNLAGVIATNAANETITTAYQIPYIKGMYDASDDLPGHRIAYFVTLEAMGSIVKATFYWLLFLLSTILVTQNVFFVVFFAASLASLVVTTEKFRAL